MNAREYHMPMVSSRSRAAWAKHSVLVKNSGAIALGSGSSAVLGFAYWWLAARAFSPDSIGRAAAVFSLMALVGMIGAGGVGTLLTGEIIQWPGRERGLISAAALFSLGLSLFVGLFAVLLSKLVLDQSLVWDLVLFIGCGMTGLANVIDQAFVGMLNSNLRLFRQFVFSAIKLLLIAWAVYFYHNESALLFSWIAAVVISLGLAEMVMNRRCRSLFHRPDFKLLQHLKGKTADHFLLDFGIQAPFVIMPYVVTVLLSATGNAVFNVIWMVMTVAFVLPAALATVLFPTVRADPKQYRDKMTLSLATSVLFAVVFGVLIFFGSEKLLVLFNPEYGVIGGTDLRFLGFGMIGAVIKFHACAAARLNNYMRQAALWLCAGGGLEIMCVAVGCWWNGLEGLSIGWTIAMTIEGAIIALKANPMRNHQTILTNR